MHTCKDRSHDGDVWFVWPCLTSKDREMVCEVWDSGFMVLDALARMSSDPTTVKVEYHDQRTSPTTVPRRWLLDAPRAKVWEGLAVEIYTATKGP